MQPFGQHINENLVGAIAHLYDKAIGAVHSPVVQSIVSLTNSLVKYSLSLRVPMKIVVVFCADKL